VQGKGEVVTTGAHFVPGESTSRRSHRRASGSDGGGERNLRWVGSGGGDWWGWERLRARERRRGWIFMCWVVDMWRLLSVLEFLALSVATRQAPAACHWSDSAGQFIGPRRRERDYRGRDWACFCVWRPPYRLEATAGGATGNALMLSVLALLLS
jgi:hypothetical protein